MFNSISCLPLFPTTTNLLSMFVSVFNNGKSHYVQVPMSYLSLTCLAVDASCQLGLTKTVEQIFVQGLSTQSGISHNMARFQEQASQRKVNQLETASPNLASEVEVMYRHSILLCSLELSH